MVLLRAAPTTSRFGFLSSLLERASSPTAFASTSRLTIASAPTIPQTQRRHVAQGYQIPKHYIPTPEEQHLSVGDIRRNHLRQKDVLLSGLPTTATPTDIRALAREPSTANDIGRIEYVYTRTFRPSGKALVSFSSNTTAARFEAAAHGRILGGRMLNAQLKSTDARQRFFQHLYGNWPSHYQLPFDLIDYETGKLVLLQNIPQDTFEARLEERLATRYDLRPQDRWRGKRSSYAAYNIDKTGHGGSHDVVLGGVYKLQKTHHDATTASFIVRCQTQGEAMRLVRRWNNTFFAPATFDIQDTAGRYRISAHILY
ncbi:uncharacterized protein MEPE_05183 [Melanopsichium pennsylvanicum]|uniref:RRM domain-containing protein n=2 Tax=Melanopsichium pennsylvanicum TaxID=63383 RepID=A0AAJ5C7F9_9BASI|nr:biotin synthase [Melanopsichium pennsylvanicum 4]SNX86474.1 uncharacterized protein MEPE_05183 [Melanopsichium pennsylvanicum]